MMQALFMQLMVNLVANRVKDHEKPAMLAKDLSTLAWHELG